MKKSSRQTYIFKLEPERAAYDDPDKCKPAQAITRVFREEEERPLYKRNPHCLDGARDDRVGDEPESDDGDEGPGPERLHDPPVARRGEEGSRDPPSEDKCGEGAELHAAHEAAVSGEPRRRLQSLLACDNVNVIYLYVAVGSASLLLG